jgi:hypothetical protein
MPKPTTKPATTQSRLPLRIGLLALDPLVEPVVIGHDAVVLGLDLPGAGLLGVVGDLVILGAGGSEQFALLLPQLGDISHGWASI